ncbi:hypothetical protein FHETE_6990 [Fusarium heterosporum]|uniref:Uncharacterized protein n=1 Tax=Fusarium heterosporum TaxID=42747 RepID=A0A8H5T7V4_FUSHE|nr:hypothetical protein FHETE_6990 [Fusarium heterosporum]
MKISNAIIPLLASQAAAQASQAAAQASQAAAQVYNIQIGDTKVEMLREAGQTTAHSDDEIEAELKRLLSELLSDGEEGAQYKTECSVTSRFEAEIYTVPDPLRAPKEIAWAVNFLDEYWKTDDGDDLPYIGDFDRYMHPEGFRVMRADYKDLPWAVRKYHEELVKEGTEMERKFIAELDGSAFFAPGVITWLAPLFAGSKVEPGKNACEDDIVDFSNWNKESNSGDVKYTFSYGERVQVGDHITVELTAQKSTKEVAVKEDAMKEDAVKKVVTEEDTLEKETTKEGSAEEEVEFGEL